MDGVATIIAALVTGGFAWVVARLTVKPAARNADAAMAESLTHRFEVITERYEAMNTALMDELTELRGEVANLTQHIDSLENVLRRNGIPIPPRLAYQRRKAQPVVAIGGQ